MVELLKDLDLLLKPIHVLDFLLGHFLNGPLLLSLPVLAQRDHAISTSSNCLLGNLVHLINFLVVLLDHHLLLNDYFVLLRSIHFLSFIIQEFENI